MRVFIIIIFLFLEDTDFFFFFVSFTAVTHTRQRGRLRCPLSRARIAINIFEWPSETVLWGDLMWVREKKKKKNSTSCRGFFTVSKRRGSRPLFYAGNLLPRGWKKLFIYSSRLAYNSFRTIHSTYNIVSTPIRSERFETDQLTVIIIRFILIVCVFAVLKTCRSGCSAPNRRPKISDNLILPETPTSLSSSGCDRSRKLLSVDN